MRIKNEMEYKYDAWKLAGYGNKELHEIQEQEIKRAFMGGVFEGLNFCIDQLDNSPEIADDNIKNLYKFY
jgi:hypothetical protein